MGEGWGGGEDKGNAKAKKSIITTSLAPPNLGKHFVKDSKLK